MKPLFGSHPRPLVVAHRGASRIAPENTLAALTAAVQGTPSLAGIEIDIQVSADGHAVLYHDSYLDKAGRPAQRVEDLAMAELTGLQVLGERIPTLRSVLAGGFLQSTRLLVELKMYGDLEGDPMLRCRRIDAVLGELLEVGGPARGPLAVLSFDPQTLRLMHLQAPHLQYVLNIGHRPPAMELAELAAEVRAGHLSGLCLEIGVLEPDLVALARGESLPVLTFTCNAPAQVDQALACGVDAILTDDPAWLAGYLEALPRSGLPPAS